MIEEPLHEVLAIIKNDYGHILYKTKTTMKFITINDIKIELKEYLTDQMLDSDYSILDDIESAAIEKVKAYTSSTINIDHELEKADSFRNADLKRTILMLMMVDIESRLTTVDVRENTLRRYNEALKYLSDIQQKKIKPTWLEKDYSESDVNKSIFDSLPRQNIICY